MERTNQEPAVPDPQKMIDEQSTMFSQQSELMKVRIEALEHFVQTVRLQQSAPVVVR